MGHGAIGEVVEGLVKRGVRAAGEGVSKAVADFHRGTAEGLTKVATRTREADARAAKSFKDLEHSGRHDVPRMGSAPARTVAPAPPSLRPPSSPHYSVPYETRLPQTAYPGRSADYHFSLANAELHETFKADPAFAQQMETQYPGIIKGVQPGPRGAFPRSAPTDQLTWHHAADPPGTMQLVEREQHRAPGPIQSSLHPDGQGGMEIWGGGR